MGDNEKTTISGSQLLELSEKNFDDTVSGDRPVLVDFWATWCGPCQAEAPIVNAIAQRYKDRGLAVIGVNTSDEDGLAVPDKDAAGRTTTVAERNGERVAFGGNRLRVNGALVYLSEVHSNVVVQASFVDGSGAENARVVRGSLARKRVWWTSSCPTRPSPPL